MFFRVLPSPSGPPSVDYDFMDAMHELGRSGPVTGTVELVPPHLSLHCRRSALSAYRIETDRNDLQLVRAGLQWPRFSGRVRSVSESV